MSTEPTLETYCNKHISRLTTLRRAISITSLLTYGDIRCCILLKLLPQINTHFHTFQIKYRLCSIHISTVDCVRQAITEMVLLLLFALSNWTPTVVLSHFILFNTRVYTCRFQLSNSSLWIRERTGGNQYCSIQ